jgi:hypothetical protein
MKDVTIIDVSNLSNLNIKGILYDDGLLWVENINDYNNSILLHLTGVNGSEKIHEKPFIIKLIDNEKIIEFVCNKTRIDFKGHDMSFVDVCEKKYIDIFNNKFPSKNRCSLSNPMKQSTLVCDTISVGDLNPIKIYFGENMSRPENTSLAVDAYLEFTIEIPLTLVNKYKSMPNSNLLVNGKGKITIRQLFDIINYFVRINKLKVFW